MPSKNNNRRDVLKSSLAWAGAAVWVGHGGRAFGFKSPNSRPRICAVGTGSRWCQKATGLDGPYGSAPEMKAYGDYVAVCDADSNRRELASKLVKEWTGSAPQITADYRAILARPDIDIVHISTPEHWHAKIAIEAMLAGKDVYCEKPMTLTIAEGQQMCQAVRKTGRIVQIGTQQRSDPAFIRAIALIRAGRIGELKKATCGVNGAPTSPKIPEVTPPKNLDWNLWLGPTPAVAFRYLAGNNGETHSWSRCHYEFRWWYEYSGGKLTDWGGAPHRHRHLGNGQNRHRADLGRPCSGQAPGPVQRRLSDRRCALQHRHRFSDQSEIRRRPGARNPERRRQRNPVRGDRGTHFREPGTALRQGRR